MLLVAHLLSRKSLLKVAFRKFSYRFDIVKGIFSVGIPSSLSHMMMSVGMIIFTRIIASFGPAAIAAYGLGFRLEGIAFHFAIGVAIATVALVGHNFGAGEIKRAKKIAWTAAGLAMVVTAFVGFLLLLAPRLWLGIFTNDALVLDQAVPYIKVLSWFFAFASLGIIMESSFQGFGKGMPKFLLTTLRLGVLAIPLAYLLSKVFGLVGVWYGIAVSNLINGLVAAAWFKFSNFKKSKVL